MSLTQLYIISFVKETSQTVSNKNSVSLAAIYIFYIFKSFTVNISQPNRITA